MNYCLIPKDQYKLLKELLKATYEISLRDQSTVEIIDNMLELQRKINDFFNMELSESYHTIETDEKEAEIFEKILSFNVVDDPKEIRNLKGIKVYVTEDQITFTIPEKHEPLIDYMKQILSTYELEWTSERKRLKNKDIYGIEFKVFTQASFGSLYSIKSAYYAKAIITEMFSRFSSWDEPETNMSNFNESITLEFQQMIHMLQSKIALTIDPDEDTSHPIFTTDSSTGGRSTIALCPTIEYSSQIIPLPTEEDSDEYDEDNE